MRNSWTYFNCETEARKYLNNADFRTCSASAYQAAIKNGWLKDFKWLQKERHENGYWNYDKCKEEANKYKYSVDFEKGSKSAYTISRQNGWIKDFTWLKRKQKPIGYWNYERCYNEAMKYKTLIDFWDYSGSAASAARKNGWITEYTWLKTRHIYTYEEIREEALKYKTLKDFYTANKPLYRVARRRKWLYTFDWLEKGKNITELVDRCYMYIDNNKKIAYVGRTMRPAQRHNQHKNGRIGKEFKKFGVELPYPVFYMDGAQFNIKYGLMIEDNLRKWFENNGWTVLNKAKTGIMSGSIGSASKKWSKKNVVKVANSCSTLKEFYTKYETAYNVALNNKWLDELFPNRNKHLSRNNHVIKMYALDGTYIRDFQTQKDTVAFFKKDCRKSIRKCLYGKLDNALGYIWKWGNI